VSRDVSRPGWIRRLAAYVLRYRGGLLLATIGALVGSACAITTPLIARQIVDHVIGTDSGGLVPWIGALLGFAALNFAAGAVRRYNGGRVSLRVQTDLRNDLQAHLQRLDFGTLGRLPTGQLVSRSSSDSALVAAVLNFLPVVGGNLVTLVLALCVMLVLSPLLAVVGLAMVPALFLVSYRMRLRTFPATWDAQQREGELVQIVDEDVAGVRVVKAFGQERRELERLSRSAVRLYGSQLRATRIQSRFQPLLEAIPSFGQVAVLALGGWLAIEGQLTLGTFLAFSTYLAQMLAPARQLAGMLTIAQQARAGMERITQVLDTEPGIADAPGAVVLPSMEGRIRLDDVRFGYDDGPEVLRGLTLEVGAGERVALVGTSGSGKTTAAMLVPRFFEPRQGTVLIDGHDVRDVTLHSLRSQIATVFEESFLFSESVRANIAYGRPDASEAEIRAAARTAQADGFIERLPRGYDTLVGERGLSLSGGQRQRIALARAILTDPRLLILDDATSAIDARTEEAIHDGLHAVLGDRTVLLVAHRQSTLLLADRVVLIDDGRVVDQGTHEELFSRNALYRGLVVGTEEPDEEDGRPESGTVTAAAWVRPAGGTSAYGARSAVPSAPSLGPGLGGGGGRSMRRALPATPELLERVAALPPVKDVPTLDLDAEGARRVFTLGSVVREFRRPLLVGLLLVVVDAVFGLLGPILMKNGIDGGIETGSLAAVVVAAGAFLAIALADLVDQVGETFVMGRVAQRVMLSLRVRIFAQLQRLSLDYYEREMAGRIMTRMTTDVDQFEQLVENGLLSALVAIVTFVGVGVALVVVDPPLGLATLTVVVPLVLATVLFRRRAARLYEQARDRIAAVNVDFQESLSGVREAQAFTHEGAAQARFRDLGASYLRSRLAAQRLVATYFPFVQFLSAVADAIVLGLGAVLILRGDLTTGALIAFLLYVDLFFSPIQQLSQVFDSWQQTTVSVRRIAELMRLDTLTPEAPAPIVPGRLSGVVELTEVRFAYPAVPVRAAERRGPADARSGVVAEVDAAVPEAISGLSLSIRPHETLALVGETGAGKSTVMKLIARFYDTDGGRVRADGLDLRDLDLRAYRSQLGYVPQEAFLFGGTVRDNIGYGRPEATDEEIEAAARAVGAHEFIATMPDGYLRRIEERGRSMSAGQRQLLALARAQLVDPAILLLDEATSNLDLATEARVSAAMQRVAHGRTTILIAHRLQTARTADRIALLDRGTVAELGSHDELLALDGRYAALWRAYETTAVH
jgi:ATP-binding cassette subfamily B protein